MPQMSTSVLSRFVINLPGRPLLPMILSVGSSSAVAGLERLVTSTHPDILSLALDDVQAMHETVQQSEAPVRTRTGSGPAVDMS